ncbi:hypothetical protein [Chitinophaga arvensicola]|uniref:Uncharacterized protein n=1 Tax=Chitinophaga arvensicola TaxID=29529 RepID=A0A1I0PN82_9BACT|nr:hypothetical protein [Chitinophaga arvensicola]SEW15812.1 hypothetical protein SAMN04488122_0879 [Chitinophaga arvensicola]
MWKRKKRPLPQWKEKLAGGIGNGIQRVQQRWAGFMNAKTKGWSRRQQKIYTTGFVLVMFAISSMLLVTEINQPALEMPATLPPMVAKPPSTGFEPHITGQEAAAIKRFLQRVDSLNATPSGRDTVAAIERRRPGFLDSLRYVERNLSQFMR